MSHIGDKEKKFMKSVTLGIILCMIFVFFNVGTSSNEEHYTHSVNPQAKISSRDLIGYKRDDSTYVSTGLSEVSLSSVTD